MDDLGSSKKKQSLAPALVNILLAWRGRGEIGGNNKGHWVGYLTQGKHGAWCAALVYTAIETAYQVYGLAPPIKRTHSARKLVKRIGLAGKFVDRMSLRPGDVVCFPRGRSWQGHVAVVVACKTIPGQYTMVDGNVGKNAKVRTFDLDITTREVVACARLPYASVQVE